VVVRTRNDVAKEVAPHFGVTLQEADRFVLLVLNEIKAMLLRGKVTQLSALEELRSHLILFP
jgi:nucleoid DNA-binding protein